MNRFLFVKNHIVLYKSTLDIYNFRFVKKKNNQILIQPCYIISGFLHLQKEVMATHRRKPEKNPNDLISEFSEKLIPI